MVYIYIGTIYYMSRLFIAPLKKTKTEKFTKCILLYILNLKKEIKHKWSSGHYFS